MEHLHGGRMSYWCVFFFPLSSNSHVSAGQSWQGNDAGGHMEAAACLGETAGTSCTHTHTHALCSIGSILELLPDSFFTVLV